MKANLILVLTMIGILGMSLISAYDTATPYTVTMKWIVPSDTSFTIALCGSETSIDFDGNLTDNSASRVEPDCQSEGASTPIMTITNAGNQDLDFTCNLTASKPAFAVLKVNNASTYSSAVAFDTTATIIEGKVAPAGESEVYLWTDLTSATAGTTQRTYQVNSRATA